MIRGRATPEGTSRFRDRFPAAAEVGHFRQLGEVWVSSVGFGTYLGEATDDVDRAYEEAIVESLSLGCNLFDCAINYRHQRSERALGRALERAIDEGLVCRDEVVVCTKGGFLPFDGEPPADRAAYVRERFIEPGLIGPEDLVADCHSLAPSYLRDQLATSRTNLGLETVDLYYLHNPEMQLEEHERQDFEARAAQAFAWLNDVRESGEVGFYGVATWDGLRLPPGSKQALSLESLVEMADDGLRAVQAPVNLAMPELLAAPTQPIGEVVVPLAVAARHFEVGLVASASILQGRLGSLPPDVAAAFPGLETDAQRALQFSRSLPGVTSALVGMSSLDHVRENLSIAEVAPAPMESIQRLFG